MIGQASEISTSQGGEVGSEVASTVYRVPSEKTTRYTQLGARYSGNFFARRSILMARLRIAQVAAAALAAKAKARDMSARMLCEFVDGSKTAVEMCSVSNATGLVPDAPSAELQLRYAAELGRRRVERREQLVHRDDPVVVDQLLDRRERVHRGGEAHRLQAGQQQLSPQGLGVDVLSLLDAQVVQHRRLHLVRQPVGERHLRRDEVVADLFMVAGLGLALPQLGADHADEVGRGPVRRPIEQRDERRLVDYDRRVAALHRALALSHGRPPAPARAPADGSPRRRAPGRRPGRGGRVRPALARAAC